MEEYIQKRAQQLQEVITLKGDAFIGVEVHKGSQSFFGEGRVLEVDNNYIIVDIRHTLKKELLENGIEFPGILILKLEEFNSDNGFNINECCIFITD